MALRIRSYEALPPGEKEMSSPNSAGTLKARESRQKILEAALASLLGHILGAALPPTGQKGTLQEGAFPAGPDKK